MKKKENNAGNPENARPLFPAIHIQLFSGRDNAIFFQNIVFSCFEHRKDIPGVMVYCPASMKKRMNPGR
jgi:hypothetical protein